MEHQQPVVTAVTEFPAAAATVEVSAPHAQPAVVAQQPELNLEPREQPKAQAFVAEPPAPEPAPVRAPEPEVVHHAAPVDAPFVDHTPATAPVVNQAPAPALVVEPAPAPALVVEPAPAPAPRAPQPDPKELLSSSGLVMIETDPSRSKSYQLEEEKVQLGRARRERPKQAEESLMQVETKN